MPTGSSCEGRARAFGEGGGEEVVEEHARGWGASSVSVGAPVGVQAHTGTYKHRAESAADRGAHAESADSGAALRCENRAKGRKESAQSRHDRRPSRRGTSEPSSERSALVVSL